MTVPKIWRKIPQYYNLIGKKCPECNKLHFPYREVCDECGCFEMQDYKFDGKGKIITYTIIRTPDSDPESETVENYCRKIPYAVAIIQLDEGPRLTAQVVDLDIAIGTEVEVIFRKLVEHGKEGVIEYGYKFKRS